VPGRSMHWGGTGEALGRQWRGSGDVASAHPMANGFNLMGPGGGGQMDGSSMAGSQHGGLANPMGGHAMHHGMMPPGAMPMHVNVSGVT